MVLTRSRGQPSIPPKTFPTHPDVKRQFGGTHAEAPLVARSRSPQISERRDTRQRRGSFDAGGGDGPGNAPHAAPKALPPGPIQTALETSPPDKDPVAQSTSGGDFMVDVFKTLDIDYLAMNCASSFRGLHESIVNYGKNVKPEILTCPHEEIAVAMGHGYAKMEGKPLAMICHGVVGLQHATMAMYNAWCDRVPVYVMGGNIIEANKRGTTPEWVHSAIDIAANVRDYTKWDDQPVSLQHFAESAVRAYKIAVTPPMGPVMLSLDAELQENPIPEAETLRIPKLSRVVPPQAIWVRSRKPRRCSSTPRRRSSSSIALRVRRRAWSVSSNWRRRCNAR